MKGGNQLFQTSVFDEVRGVITVIDQLRDYGLDKQISLPRIVVLGTQSSGKSSLLENIVGLDFLPRGSGVVTRRPLELRLVHVDARRKQKSYAVFDIDKGKRYTDFSQVCQRIIDETNKVAGSSLGIVDDPIKLTIYSNDCPDLTIIDLPGITRIDIAGQKDVFKITTEMAKRYCSDERTIILCVIPANADMSTSDGLKFAKQFDKTGERTIGVVTKIDIMDKGTNAKKMLLNQEIQLKLGYVGIRNRSQQDINNKVTVQQSLVDQQNFFENSPDYKNLPAELLGTRSLTSKLSEILKQNIVKNLPEIFKQINFKINQLQQRLDDLGTALPSSSREKLNYLMLMIADFTNSFQNTLSGRYDAKSKAAGGGAKIREDFRTIYDEFTSTEYKCSQDYTDEHIDQAIKIHQGDQIQGFPSMDSFLFLMIPQIQKLKLPAYETLEEIYLYLCELALEINKKIFGRFPEVLQIITFTTNQRLFEKKQKAKGLIDNLLNAEINVVFTNDENYLSARNQLLAKTTTTNPQKLFIQQIRDRLDAYFRIVVRALNDSIPKTVGYFLIKQSQDSLQMLLYNQIASKQSIIDSLGEAREVQIQREKLHKNIDVLKKSIRRIKNDPSVSSLIKDINDDY